MLVLVSLDLLFIYLFIYLDLFNEKLNNLEPQKTVLPISGSLRAKLFGFR